MRHLGSAVPAFGTTASVVSMHMYIDLTIYHEDGNGKDFNRETDRKREGEREREHVCVQLPFFGLCVSNPLTLCPLSLLFLKTKSLG